jgi:hypothetical protein
VINPYSLVHLFFVGKDMRPAVIASRPKGGVAIYRANEDMFMYSDKKQVYLLSTDAPLTPDLDAKFLTFTLNSSILLFYEQINPLLGV